MEIASTSTNLNMFPTDQRYKIKDVGCKSTSSSFSRRNPKLRPDEFDVLMATPKKRKHSDDEKPPEKRQKKIVEPLKSKVITTEPGDKTENKDRSLKDLIAKAREKVEEKRQIDHRKSDIASQRIADRLALNQMVKTVDFDDHLTYHMELENLGCDFISDQVSCLNKFDLLSRSDYYFFDESNSE